MNYDVLKKISVLYVEDDEFVAEATYDYLKEYCDEVYMAHNGKDGLELYYTKKPDVIITDIAMPVMDGLKMSGKIRESDHDTPIIINSAFSDVHLFIEAINNDVNDYILKPTNTEKLIESLYKNAKYTLMARAINSHQKMMQSILDEINDPIFLLELDYSISIINKTAQKMLNEHKCFDNSNVSKEELFYKAIKEKTIQKEEIICKDTFKKTHYFEILYKPILENEKVYSVLKILHDITEHKILENELSHKANHDKLTNLPNRASLYELMNEEIKNNKNFALFFIDLDNFKSVNDTYGHDIGDNLLIDVSKRIKRVLKESDFVARLGGDEFCVVIKNISDRDIIAKIAQKINKTISTPFILNEQKINTTCSIGISLYPQDAKNLQKLIKNADSAMYQTKQNGRNGFNFYKGNKNV